MLYPDEETTTDDLRDAALCRRPSEEPEPMEPERPMDRDWRHLLEIVADVFRVLPSDLAFPSKVRTRSVPRHLLAAIWSEAYTMDDARKRLRWWSAGTVAVSRARIHQHLADGGIEADRINEVMRRVSREIPHVVGIYPEEHEEPGPL